MGANFCRALVGAEGASHLSGASARFSVVLDFQFSVRV